MGLWDDLFGGSGQAGQLPNYQGIAQNPYSTEDYRQLVARQQQLVGISNLQRGTVQAPQIQYDAICPIAIRHAVTQKVLIVWEL